MARIAEPAALRLLKGNGIDKDQAGRPVNPGPKFDRGAPEPPCDLSPEARLEWNRVVPALDRLDLLKDADYGALVEHCETWSNYIAAIRCVRAEGITLTHPKTGAIYKNPALAVSENMGRELRASCREFGLTPSSEQRLSGPVARDDNQDPFAVEASA